LSAHAELVWERRWVTSLLLAGLTFGAGLAFRHVRWPAALTWLGLISYSVYLLHPLLVEVYYHLPWVTRGHPFWLQMVLAGAFLVVLIAFSSVTYLAVERPMQDAGRRVARWLDGRFGPDRARDLVPADREPVLVGRTRAVTE
jgi:peptidoglycan/LPS O-acetylase OafA/YrhL